jgi:glycosyltransferase involved in cell wall biosynthesis
MDELVSIIIPVYNRGNLIIKTLESIRAQSYQNWECILVDDGSIDNTVEVVEDFVKNDSRFRLFSRPEKSPKGANSCRNYGFLKSKGGFVNWFDSDDTMHTDFITKKLNAFDKDETVDLVLSKTVRLEQNKESVFETRTNLTDNLLEDYITRKVSWYMPDGMFKRYFLNKKVLFDEQLKGGQDRDFYVKALILNPKVIVIDFYATNYLVHAGSISEILYRKNNKESHAYNFSHFESLINQVGLLNEKHLMSERLKEHYFMEIKKKMPSIIFLRNKTRLFYKALHSLSSKNKFYFKQWNKVFFASLSFFLFGKGEKFLK